MSAKKRLIADLLFGVQIIGALVLCGSQFFRLLQTTQGQSFSMWLLMELYLALHLWLALGAHRAQPSRVTKQTVFTYCLWLALIVSNLGAVIWNGGYRWSVNDTSTVTLALVGTAIVLAIGKSRGIGFKDPVSKSFLAMLFKALPQFLMAIKVAQEGGAGVPMVAVIAGNATIIIRIVQVWFAIREAGWERNRTWLFVSEVVNELSWATVSVVWFCWYLS